MAKKTVWDLSLEIAGKDTGASAALRQVQREMKSVQDAGKQLGKDFKDFASNAGKLALGVVGGIAAATTGVVAMANSFAAAGDNVAKTSNAIGIGIEAYQGLQHAMGQSGVSAEEFDSALKKFNQTVRLGAAGNVAARKQLEDIGLSAQKLAGMKPEEAMMRLSDYMKSLPNDAARTQVALTVFGKAAGPRMMGAMKQGSAGLQELMDEAKALGIVMTDEQAHQSEAYVDAITRLKQSATGMKNQFIGSAIGPLTEAFDHLKDAIVEQMPAIQEMGKAFGQWLGDVVKRLPEMIAKIKEFGTWVKNTVTGIKDFVGGWKNLAKILAGLAIAPTFISGLKVVWSLGEFIKVAIGAIGPLLGGLSGGFGALAAAALPIIGIIAGIALVIYTVVKNFDTLKQYALDCIERIKSAFSGATGGMAVDWQKVGEVAKTVLGIIMSILEGSVLFAIKTVMNAITSAIQIVIGAFKVLWNVVKLILWPIETIIKIIIGLFTGGWGGAIEALKGQFGKLVEIFSGMFEGMKVMIGSVVGFWKNYFNDAVSFIKGIIDGLAEKFGGVFDTIKNAFEAFINFFKAGFDKIKGFFGGIGDFFSGVWGDIKNAASNAWSGIKNVASNAWEGIKGAASTAGGFLKNNWKSIAIGMVNPIAGGLHALYENHEGFRNLVDGVWGKIKDVAGNAWEGIKGAARKAWGGMKNIGGKAIENMKQGWSVFKDNAGNVWESVKEKVGGYMNWLEGKNPGLVGQLKGAWQSFSGFFGDLWGSMKQGPSATMDFITNSFSNLFANLKEKFFGIVNTVKWGFQNIGNFVNNIVGGLPESFQNAFAGIKTIIDVSIGFWKNVFGSAITAIRNIIGLLPGIFEDPVGTIKAIFTEFVGFWKNVFQSAVDTVSTIVDVLDEIFGGIFNSIKAVIENVANVLKTVFQGPVEVVKGIIGGLTGIFTGVFDAIKSKIAGFTDFFTNKFEGIKNFFGGIGDNVGGFIGGAVDKFKSFLPGHAEGGIFTHRHIAEIAERGAEAVVPLNNSPNGFDIWKQAGEIGGYASRQQMATASTSGTPPVMQAAAQRISNSENVVNVNFSQNNTFSGGTPDKETVNQISAAGKQAADDIEARFKILMENFMRNQRRVSYV